VTGDAGPKQTNQFSKSPFTAEGPAATGASDSYRGLRSLITAEDLSVVFQPIVHAGNGQIFAYEALVRCRLPRFANPMDLFRRAVDEKCTGRLGRMIREKGLELVTDAPLFLNVHPAELEERWLVRPDDPLYFHSHPVYLEVTEAVPLSHSGICREVLNEVRARGNVMIVVDDLGAGFSNLKHIADLEPKIVKLDRDLVSGIERHPRQRRLVAGIVRLCEDLGAEVLAEGVETVDELHALRDTGMSYLQGYLFARPAFPLPQVVPIGKLRVG
jgi:EAL domain-containing protein (putative c-di-GMP-specific phosphodiesterase class I)